MKLIRAGRFAAGVFAVAMAYIFLLLPLPLAVSGEWSARSSWFASSAGLWQIGGWLALLAIFAWMVLLITLMYTYIPTHRVTTSLEMGLMLIGAVLLIAGVIIWMNLLPLAADAAWAAFVDNLALTFLGAGLFMGGAVTAWLATDLARLEKLSWRLVAPGLVAGLVAVLASFLLPNLYLTLPALLSFLLWGVLLGARRTVPPSFPEFRPDQIQRPTRPERSGVPLAERERRPADRGV